MFESRRQLGPPSIRGNRFLLLLGGLVVVGTVVYMIRGAILPFVIGGGLAYMVHPLVTLVERAMPWRRSRPLLARMIALFAVFVIVAGAVAGALVVIIPPASEQFSAFIGDMPDLFTRARQTVEGWSAQYSDQIPEEIRLQIEATVADAGSIVIESVQNIVVTTVNVVSRALTIVIGLAIVPLFLYYVLKDRESLAGSIASMFPPGPRYHAKNVVEIVNSVLGSYVKAQLILGVVVGVMAFVGLSILGVESALFLGVVAGVFELVPIIGPWLGAIPGVLVVLASSPEKLVWVALMYLGIQLLENSLLLPRIQSRALNVHPILIMVVLVVGSEVAGLWGIILGPPMAVAGKEVYLYFSRLWVPEEAADEPGSALAEAERTPGVLDGPSSEPEPEEVLVESSNGTEVMPPVPTD